VKHFSSIVLLLFVSNLFYSQPPWCWAKDALGTSDNIFEDMATDPATGISYAVGYFNDDLSSTFTQGYNGTPDMSNTFGNQDGLVAKYDPSGNPIWAFKIGKSGESVWIKGVEIGPTGNIYITGYFDDRCDFDGTVGSGSQSITAAPNNKKETFIAKYDANGFFQWVRQGTNLDDAFGNDIAVNGTHVYVTGWFENTITFDGAPALTANDGFDSYVIAYDLSGTFAWQGQVGDNTGNNEDDLAFGVAADNNNVYITGDYQQTIEFNGGPTQLTASNLGLTSSYIAEYNALTGTLTWVGNITSDGPCGTRAIAIDANYIYTVGGADGNVMFNGFGPVNVPGAGKEEAVIFAIDRPFKVTQWVNYTDDPVNTSAYAQDVITDGNGHVYVTGSFQGASSFNNATYPVNAVGGSDLYIAHFKDAGTFFGVITATDNNNLGGLGLGVDNWGSTYVVGMMESQGTFGTLPILGDGGGDDALIAKYSCSPCNASYNYTKNIFCEAIDADPTPVGSFDALGSFTSTPIGLSLNSSSGLITLGSTTQGTYYVTYTSPNLCTDIDTIIITNTCCTGPSITTCENDTTITAGPSCTITLGDFTSGISYTNGCGLVTLTQSPIAGSVLPSGTDTVWLYTTDANGDVDSCSFQLTVQSAVNPTIVSCGTYLVGETTAGSGDTENNFGCVGFATPGEDVYYQVTVPAGNYSLQITIDNVVDATDAWLETFWIGDSCPLGGGCISSDFYDIATQQFPSTGSNSLQFLALGPGTYYFVVDSQNDSIDSYDISFECLSGGIEFDTSLTCGDPNNDGIIPYVNGSTTLTTQACQSVNICHDMYIANPLNAEWVDSVYMNLGPCYTNVVPTTVSGFYQPGNWIGNYNGVANAISWEFNNTSVPTFGDGSGAYYSCDLGKTRLHTLCFTADISSSCIADSNLNISLLISDDEIGTSSSTVASFDYILSDDFTITNPTPTISCPANVNSNTDIGVCTSVVSGIAPTATGDNCPGEFVSYTLSGATTGSGTTDASGSVFNIGTTTVTYFVSDSLGSIDSCSFTVSVADNKNPVVTCVGNISTPNDVGVCTAVVNAIAPLTTTDNCTIDSVSYTLTGATTGSGLNDASGLVFNTGTTTVTYTIYDIAGNSNTCSFTITVTDNINPVITCPGNVNTFNDPGVCSAVITAIAPLTATDDCAIDSVSYLLTGATTGSGLNNASGLVFNLGVTTVTYIICDLSGNVDSCNFTVTVSDNTNPTITCPNNVAISCPAIVNGIAPVTTSDNCGIDSVNYILTGATTGSGLNDASGIFYNTGITTITYTITDLSGNTSTCNFTTTVNDAINPIITCPNNVNISCPAVINGIAPVITSDNCGIDSVNYILTGATTGSGLNDASGIFYNTGITTITYTITDLSGNTSTCGLTVTVNDTVNPTISCPNDVTISCPAIVNSIAPLTIGDNCGIDSVSYILTGATTGSGLNDASGLFYNTGVTTIAYTITDLSGNTSACNFTVTVNDVVDPIITCPGNTTTNTPIGLCSVAINNIAPLSATDNCGIDSISFVLSGATLGSGLNDASGLAFNTGITTVTYFIYDIIGNVDSCSFTATVTDNINPIITCPGNITANTTTGLCAVVVNNITPLSATDNCGIDSVSFILSGATLGSGLNDASGLTFNTGITTVTYTITDLSGNTSDCNFVVVVIDNENPTITCPGNISANNDAGTCTAVVNGINPTGLSDNCGIDSVNYVLTGATTGSGLNDASGFVFNLGTTSVTYTITDLSGNSISCNFSVTIIDNENPSISCSPNLNIPNTLSGCNVIVTGISPTGLTDNCGIDSVNYVLAGATTGSGLNDASGLAFNLGSTTVTYTITDLSGNSTSCSFTISIADNIPPTIICPGSATVNNDIGSCDAIINNIAPVSFNDNCLVDTVYYILSGATIGNGANDASGTLFNIGSTTINYIITDQSGNSDTCAFTITVIDNEDPTIICPANIVICDTNVIVPVPVFGDNCMVNSIVNDFNLTNNASGVFPYGISTINWTVTDTSGNTNSCLMTVKSEIPPISNAGDDQVLLGISSTNFSANNPIVGLGNWINISGFGNIFNTSNPSSSVDLLEPGDNIFEWVVSNGTCIDAVDEVIITMVPLVVPNGFSPNNDGDNDFFEVEGLEMVENEVTIFNRWGIELFSANNYQNNWDGRSKSGENLPEDTYFYIIKIPKLDKELSGFIVLKR